MKRARCAFSAIVLIALGMLPSPPALAGDDAVAVIVNKSNNLDSLPLGELTRIYRGEQDKWPDGQRILVLDHAVESPARTGFYHLVLQAAPGTEFFQPGSPIPFRPLALVSDVATRRFVTRVPNAIGYVAVGEVDDTVKVLKIDGSLPSDPGYKLSKLRR